MSPDPLAHPSALHRLACRAGRSRAGRLLLLAGAATLVWLDWTYALRPVVLPVAARALGAPTLPES